jgi:hypothetical protein
VKKNPANNDPAKQGLFETRSGGATADDTITGEKRFQAIIERYVWSGQDAAPGNAHVGSYGGTYNQLSSGTSKPGYAPPYSGGNWEVVDGPDPPNYPAGVHTDPWVNTAPNFSGSTIEAANNPARALMKYRVVYFRYLNE